MRYFEICCGDDAGYFEKITGVTHILPYDCEIIEPVEFIPGRKKMGDYTSFLACHDIFSLRIIEKFTSLLLKWGELIPIRSNYSKEVYFFFRPRKFNGIDLAKTNTLVSTVTNNVIGFFEIKFSEALSGDEIFHPGIPGGACCTLYSEDFIYGLFRLGAIGYYLVEWSEGPKYRRMLNRDFSEMNLTDAKKTMRVLDKGKAR